MAQLLCINAMTKTAINNLGDIVGIYEDDHKFSQAEIAGFDIVSVKETVKEIQDFLQSLIPIEYYPGMNIVQTSSMGLLDTNNIPKELQSLTSAYNKAISDLAPVAQTWKDTYSDFKYQFRLADAKAIDLASMLVTNIVKKV